MVKWLKHHAYDQHGLGLKPCTIPLGKTLYGTFSCLVVLASISIKLQVDCNILVSLKAGHGNCLPYVLVPLLLSCESGG